VFNIGPLEIVVLAIVGIIVIGPDRLPGLARDAARMLRTLREMTTGARQQLQDELGPEFADLDLQSLNPRTAVQRAVFGDDVPDLRKYDPRRIDPDAVIRDTLLGEDGDSAEPAKPVSMTKQPPAAANGSRPPPAAANGSPQPPAAANGNRPRPRPKPRTAYDDEAT
jgi:sec-independent protein translocase protein TatB